MTVNVELRREVHTPPSQNCEQAPEHHHFNLYKAIGKYNNVFCEMGEHTRNTWHLKSQETTNFAAEKKVIF
jgi:hypothetical protein